VPVIGGVFGAAAASQLPARRESNEFQFVNNRESDGAKGVKE
jgi:hypothetical protein